MLIKSPSGSACPYYFMGGELHPLHYGSYFDDKKGLFEIIKAEEIFILNSFGKNNRRIWIDLYDTNFDNEAIDFLLDHLEAINAKILKLGLFGLSNINQCKISKKMKNKNNDLYIKTKYFNDPEEAKMWLIGKNGVHIK
jgi:hypothetical protein